MNRVDLQEIAETRIQESGALLAAGFPDGAYYLAGYAVECALKACIAKRTREHDFPEKSLATRSYTHKLQDLLVVAELKTELETTLQADPIVQANWTIVKDWSEECRYEKRTFQEAEILIRAIEDKKGGLLPWIMQRW
jgi:HEPN domain-containing protein